MAIHLVRHAKAGSRHDWAQPDELRPLTEAGERQAAGLVELLADEGVKRILSSRYARCVQTVAPLADALGLEVERHEALAEEADPADVWELLNELGTTEAVLCTHGNIVEEVLEGLVRRGVLPSRELASKKGSVWTLETNSRGRIRRARYTAPG